MKKTLYAASMLLLCACGGATSTSETADTDSSATTAESTPVDNSILDPMVDDLSGELTVNDLVKSMNVYYGTEIQVILYPFVYVDGDPFKQDMTAAAVADGATAAYIKFTTVPTETVKKGQPYLFKAKIESVGYNGELYLKDATLGSLPADYNTDAFNPKAISSTALYSASDIQANIQAWDKKVVTVTGDYNGTTISKSSDGKSLLEARVDLSQTGVDYNVGCCFATEEETNVFQAGQLGVKVKGTLDYRTHWGSPYLNACAVVN